ncbi:MAG: DUF3426 domain-containing protein [Xanthomonadales bacterium]|nr:DUF3426 domain-containing protein [Xanthomonadales bacterium]
MYTRCPECDSVHALSASLLAGAGGRVRCANCRRSFDARTALFDEWPEQSSKPATFNAHGQAPVVGSILAPPPTETLKDEPLTGRNTRLVWIAALTLLIPLTMANLAWVMRDDLARTESFGPLMERLGWAPANEGAGQADAIHLVSRDLHPHPQLAGLLVLSATFVSLAEEAIPYPDIELTLSDPGNVPLARRRFTPREYLPREISPSELLKPGVHVPILIEFGDPGRNATGFEIRFR